MTNLEQAAAQLSGGSASANAMAAWTAALMFAEMRIDPLNPGWARADWLVYTPDLEDMVRRAWELAGADPRCVPDRCVARLAEAPVNAGDHRVFCLACASGVSEAAGVLSRLGARGCAISDAEPPSAADWSVVHCASGSPAECLTFLRAHLAASEKPLWIVAGGNANGRTVQNHAPQSRQLPPSNGGLPPLAKRMAHLGTETAFNVLAQVNALRAEGHDIISFGLGEPDFDTPVHVKEAAKTALDENETHYGPSQGLPELRAAIARYMERTRHVQFHPDEVVVTPGAKPIIFDAVMALVDPGDEVLYPNPGYPIYESVVEWVGATAVPVPLREENQWDFDVRDLEARITPRTKMIIMNTPGNPTGSSIGPHALEEIARLAIANNIWVVTDEVYSQIVFDSEFHSIVTVPGMKERTIVVDGFSKTYAMTGWRLGYGLMNRALAEQVAKIETNIDSCSCTFSQIAAVQALEGSQREAEEMVRRFGERGKTITELLNNIEGVSCLPPQGAFYVFPNVTGACRNLGLSTANELQKALLHEAGVAVLPRTCFGRRNEGEDQEYLRLSFATSMENIREGLRRMKEFIERK